MKKPDGTLSVRLAPSGGDVAPRVSDPEPLHWLDGATRIVLLIHGFNNSEKEADDAFNDFLARLPNDITAKVGKFFWPGDADFPFLKFLSYPTEIPQAQESALRLASFLTGIRRQNPTVEFFLVGHSLGCRLILELLDILRTQQPPEQPAIKLISLMAPAVPTKLTEANMPLERAGQYAETRLVWFSKDDRILQFAFPAGQSLAYTMGNETSVYLEALGRHGNPHDFANKTMDRAGNDHGDYWRDAEAIVYLARELNSAIPQPPLTRETPTHKTASPHRTPYPYSSPIYDIA